MTLAAASFDALLDIAAATGCSGVEVRNDLADDLFNGQDPVVAGHAAKSRGLNIYALAEVKAFNQLADQTLSDAKKLMDIAVACGATGISLIPRCDGEAIGNRERSANLLTAIRELKPLLDEYKLIGLIEPLGFEASSVRYKSEVLAAIDTLGAYDTFKIIHDTFHHKLAGEKDIYPDHTAIVHISGVVEKDLAYTAMLDKHRGLVDRHDRLDNIEQLTAFASAGFDGPVSVEAFAPDVHAFTDPKAQLCGSFDFITSAMAANAA